MSSNRTAVDSISDREILLSESADLDINDDIGTDQHDKKSNALLRPMVLTQYVRCMTLCCQRLQKTETLSVLFQFSMLLISLVFIGHIPHGDSALLYASAGLASSFVNVTSTPVGHGLATAADTLCSQAYGFRNYKRVGIVLQRGIFILGLFVLPICGLLLNAESLLLLFHQPPCVASLSAFYMKMYCIALPFVFLFILLQHYLQSQSLVWQFVAIGLLANCVNIILHALMIFAFDLGFKGAVIALVVSSCLPSLLVIFYIRIRRLHRKTWGGWSFESLNEWLQFFKLAIPGLIMLCIEWWSAEVATFIAGYISEDELAANSAWFQAASVVYMPTIGFTSAVSIRVGNELGAGNPRGAKKASFVAIGCILFLCIVYTALFLISKDYIGTLLVPGNEAVRKKIANLMYVATITIYFDHVQSVIGGVLRGSGRQYIGAIMNFISYYIIGLPLGITLAIKVQWGVIGFWIGFTIGCAVLSITFMVILLRTNWKKLSETAMKRAQGQNKELHDTSLKFHTETSPNQHLDNQIKSSVAHMNSSNGDNDEQETAFSEEPLISSAPAISSETELNQEDVDNQVGDDQEDAQTLIKDRVTTSDDTTVTLTRSHRMDVRSRVLLVLRRSSLFVIGITILVAGGISSKFYPHVDPMEYENCTMTTLGEVKVNDSRYW